MGIDFTGGTMLQLNMGKQVEMSQVNKVLNDYDIQADLQYAGADNEKIIIKTTSASSAKVPLQQAYAASRP